MRAVAESPLSELRIDMYGQGGYVGQFEGEMAELLGKEAAVFMPSGTMAQQIALRVWSDDAGIPTVAFHPTCHLYIHEQMGFQELHHLKARLVGDSDRLITLSDIEAIDQPVSTLLLELPQREIGGQLPTWEDLVAQCEAARAKGMKLQMDGARLWECQPYYSRSYRDIAALFDSVYVSVYKILGGLPGAVLAGPAEFIAKARVWQRRHGGNLQQQAINAIAARLGLDEQLPQIPTYVAKAREIAAALQTFDRVRVVPEQPPTNMMHLYLTGNVEKLLDAALQVAEESKVGVLFWLRPDGCHELTIADAALEIETAELVGLFARIFELAPLD